MTLNFMIQVRKNSSKLMSERLKNARSAPDLPPYFSMGSRCLIARVYTATYSVVDITDVVLFLKVEFED
jgi:hypothetical protein